ncbi:MAG TPA: hypothetical protein VLX92_20925, partial [Kofleriaceae bacterium]|nr:hypothetical protein [Kofleriaceae bacterium]
MSVRTLSIALCLAACGGGGSHHPDAAPPAMSYAHSSSIALAPDGSALYVVNADLDSVSVIDPNTRALVAEIPLGPTPAVDASGEYAPAVMPRALAVSPDGATLYVTGERSSKLYAIDTASRQVANSLAVGSEPVGVVVSPDGAAVYVATSQDRTVVKVTTGDLQLTSTVDLPAQPWALGWSPTDGSLLATLFQGSAVVAIDPDAMTVRATWMIPTTQPRGDARLAHGVVRGLYDVAARPGTGEVWLAHVLLGIDTPQPALDFERTAFPSLSIVQAGTGAYQTTLSTDAQDVPGIDGSFADVASGPHAIAFTSDGAYALMVDTNSEDVLVVDAASHVEVALARPLPGHMPEGIALAADDRTAYIDERNTGDVAVVKLATTASGGVTIAPDGAPIARSTAPDPMPAELRFGQHLFYSAQSDEYPLTTNHWISCATCHMEGRSDAVTWLFAQGPRDTPTNAGGTLGTGFLFRTADRNQVQDYWHTINVEQGGAFDPVSQASLLDAIAAYVNHAIPLPIPPTTDPVKVAAGMAIFNRADVGCSGCH